MSFTIRIHISVGKPRPRRVIYRRRATAEKPRKNDEKIFSSTYDDPRIVWKGGKNRG